MPKTPQPQQKSIKPKVSGGQLGNTNALKHGFYSKKFNNLELKELDTLVLDGLLDDINNARVIIRYVFDLASDEELEIDEWFTTLNCLGAAAVNIVSLLCNQKLLDSTSGDMAPLFPLPFVRFKMS
jgi:hypothetical protein